MTTPAWLTARSDEWSTMPHPPIGVLKVETSAKTACAICGYMSFWICWHPEPPYGLTESRPVGFVQHDNCPEAEERMLINFAEGRCHLFAVHQCRQLSLLTELVA